MPVRILVTEGTAADCQQAGELIDGIDAQYLLADRAYDTDAILRHCQKQNIEAVIPAKRNRKEQREHDMHLYRHRHLVENAFLWLKRWRRELEPPVSMGVGGLFDFYSGRIPRAPVWMREMGLEWVFRLMQEPGRMWRRYVIGNPLFLHRVRQQVKNP